MKPVKLRELIKQGSVESYKKGQVFYALDFKAEIYIVKKGYVNRYSLTKEDKRVMESIYGPDYLFPLSPIYKKLLHLELSRESNTYVYEAMTDVEIQGITSDVLAEAAEKDPSLYKDLFYEAGVRLKANINRLSSNAIQDEYQRVTHQLVYLAEEFGKVDRNDVKTGITLQVPIEPLHMAEQLNISVEVAQAALTKLAKQGLIKIDGAGISIPDVSLLKDVYF